MATPPRQLFIIVTVFLSTTVATATINGAATYTPSYLPPPLSQSLFLEHTHPLNLLGPVLTDLGFEDLAAAAPSLSTTTAWRGPITVFAPTDSSLLTCPSCSVQILLQEHTVPGLFPIPYLRTLAFGTKIETLAPGRCLTITSTNNPSSSKIFVGGVEITHPDLFNDGLVVVHGLQGFISHLSPYSCRIERMTSLSFLPSPPHSQSFIMRLMLKDAMLRLRISGYSVLAIALRVKYPELMDLGAVTVFALDDGAIFSSGHAYVTEFRFHVVPNRLLMAADLERLPAGTLLQTMEPGHKLVVTTAGGGGLLAPIRINYVKIKSPDLMYNLKIVIHGLSMPFPHVNLTAAVGLNLIGGPRIQDMGGSEINGKTGIGYSTASNSKKEWTAEIEDHHGL